MKTLFVILMLSFSLCSMAQDQKKEEEVMTKSKGVYVVNTTTLCNTRGFKGTTPLKVTIKKNKILKIEALRNMETPRFFKRLLEEMFPKYEELEMKDAENVDCVTGATMSSKAVKDNVKAAIEYYKEHK